MKRVVFLICACIGIVFASSSCSSIKTHGQSALYAFSLFEDEYDEAKSCKEQNSF